VTDGREIHLLLVVQEALEILSRVWRCQTAKSLPKLELLMSPGQDLEIELDFTRVQQSAKRVRTMLVELRRRFDVTPFEFCKKVRIAPTEVPHSHPRITLNTWARDDLGLLSTYLHEQLHWYVTWFSYPRS
jgi:hypothetical protein